MDKTEAITFVCRCEDITEEQVREAIDMGMETLDELKRALRVGMGPCQGRTCGPILVSMLARAYKKRPQDVKEWKQRPPLKPVPVYTFYEAEPAGDPEEKGNE